MIFAELKRMTLDEQKQWAKTHPEELTETVYNECSTQYHNIGAVLPQQCCLSCKGCALKGAVEGILRVF